MINRMIRVTNNSDKEETNYLVNSLLSNTLQILQMTDEGSCPKRPTIIFQAICVIYNKGCKSFSCYILQFLGAMYYGLVSWFSFEV